jgi:hypothetical protein
MPTPNRVVINVLSAECYISATVRVTDQTRISAACRFSIENVHYVFKRKSFLSMTHSNLLLFAIPENQILSIQMHRYRKFPLVWYRYLTKVLYPTQCGAILLFFYYRFIYTKSFSGCEQDTQLRIFQPNPFSS